MAGPNLTTTLTNITKMMLSFVQHSYVGSMLCCNDVLYLLTSFSFLIVFVNEFLDALQQKLDK